MPDFIQITGLKRLDIEKSQTSFVSSKQSEERINIDYYFNRETHHLFAKVTYGKFAQGPPNHVHGGAISAVVDEAMGVASWLNGYPAMTATLTTNFVQPLPLGVSVLVDAWIEKMEKRKIWVHSNIVDVSGNIYSHAEGLFIKISQSKFQKMGRIPDKYFRHVRS